MDATDTKSKILDVAEKLFVEKGISATSLRAITAGAGTNLASVNYHFGSKAELIEAVFARRVGPVNNARLEKLSSIDFYGDKAEATKKLIYAFVAPLVHMSQTASDKPAHFVRLFGQIHAESDDIKQLLFNQMEEVSMKFVAAFQKAMPNESKEEIFWKFRFMIGVMVMSIMQPPKIKPFSLYPNKRNNPDKLLERMVAFIAAGFGTQVPDTIVKRGVL